QGTTGACATQPSASVIGGPAPYWQSFAYDKTGNRTGETRHGIGGTTDTTRTYTYAPAGQGNRLTQVTQTGPAGNRTDTYGYDATGNTATVQNTDGAQTFTWNTEGELAKVTENGNDETYIYDADGNRLIRKDPAGSTLYLPEGNELRALNGATTATGTRYYAFAGKTVAMRTSNGQVTYLSADHQGSGQVAINATTQAAIVRRFTPFGSIRGFDENATWPNDKGFVGGTQDPTGLTHLGAREYDPDTGRFISVDPLVDQADPQQMNGYTYANNSPITNSDPDGNMCRRTPDGVECFNGDGVDRRPTKHGYDVYDRRGRKVGSTDPSWRQTPRGNQKARQTLCSLMPAACPPRAQIRPPRPYDPPSLIGDFLAGLNLKNPWVASSNGAGYLSELMKALGLGGLALENDLYSVLGKLGLSDETVNMLRRTIGGSGGSRPPSGNLYVKGAKVGSKIGKLGGRALTVSKVAGPLGIGISVVDGVNTQVNNDKQRSDLTSDDKRSRLFLRGAGAGVGAYVGASLGTFCGPAALACGVAGGYLGAAAGGAIGGWVGRKFYGG
ncbi:RHS repeat-associated core domain-containing protein, partial [Actinomadura geliboluensis]